MHNNNNYEYEEVTAVFFSPVFGEQKLSHHKTMGPYYLYNGFTKKKKKHHETIGYCAGFCLECDRGGCVQAMAAR